MAKNEVDNLLSEIDAFIEEEKKPKRKRRTKKEMEAARQEIVEEVKEEIKVKKTRGRKKKEVTIEEVVEEPVGIEEVLEENRVIEETAPVPEVTVETEVIEKTLEVEVVPERETVSVVEDEEDDDDLYITRSFQPIKKKKRLKRSIVKFLKFLLVLGILGILGWIIGNKIYGMYLNTRPVNIYKNSVIEIGRKVTGTLNSLPIKDNYNFEIQFETNMKKYNYLNGYAVGYGYLSNERYFEDYIYYLDGNYEYNGLHTILKNNKVYKKYDVSDVLYVSKDEDSNVRDVIEALNNDIDNVNYVIEGNSKVISSIIEEKDVTVSSEELDINGDIVKVRCNTIVLSEDLVDRYIEELYKNSELVKKMSLLFDKDSNVLRRYLKDKLYDYVNDVKFNLYVNEKYQFVGFDYELDGFREMYYYQYKDKYDVNIKLNKYINKFIGLSKNNKANLGIDVNDKNVDVLLDSNSKFNLVIKELAKNVINFQYKNSDSSVSIDVIIKDNKIVIEYKNDNGKYLDIDIHVSEHESIFNSIDFNDVTSSSKKISEAKEEFDKHINTSQKKSYELINDFIYGNLKG